MAEKGKRIKLDINKRHIPLIAILILVIMTCLSLGIITFSKYVLQSQEEELYVPTNFVFLSDYLKEGGAEYNVYTNFLDIEIRNTDGLSITELDIKYTISVSSVDENGNESSATLTYEYSDETDDTIDLEITDDDTFTISGEYKILSKRTSSKDEYTLSANKGDVVTITATSSDPYVKTLSATFTFVDAGDKTTYTITDKGYYSLLEIYTGKDIEDTEITIQYTSDFYPDNSNPTMEDWMNTDGEDENDPKTITGLATDSYYIYVFYEENIDYDDPITAILGDDNTIKLTKVEVDDE